MKRILIGWMAALSALLCACSAQTVWETVDGGCVPAEGGAAYAIRIALPQDAVEEVFAERGARQIYTQPGVTSFFFMMGISFTARKIPSSMSLARYRLPPPPCPIHSIT